MKEIKKIAILGTRGVPANYGGFETFTEELGKRLVAKGYEVTVYCREGNSDHNEPTYKGMKLVTLPTIRHKYFETIAHTFYSTLHVIGTDAQLVYYCNAINSIYMILPRLFGKKVIINVDGLEWKRAKWSRIGKFAYQISEWIATIFAHRIISDSKRISLYYKKKFHKDTILISYGATGRRVDGGEAVLKQYRLTSRHYLLYVSRLEPENNAHVFIEAYEKVKTDMPLVIVGYAPYGAPYIDKLRATKDARILFLGPVYGESYHALLNNAYLYLHGNQVGGTNPALLEAMSVGNCVVAHGVGFNREVIGSAGVWYKPGRVDNLVEKLEYLLANPNFVESVRPQAIARMREKYDWDKVADQYDHFIKEDLCHK